MSRKVSRVRPICLLTHCHGHEYAHNSTAALGIELYSWRSAEEVGGFEIAQHVGRLLRGAQGEETTSDIHELLLSNEAMAVGCPALSTIVSVSGTCLNNSFRATLTMISCDAFPIDVTGVMFVLPLLSAPMKLKINAKSMANRVWPTLSLNWTAMMTHVKI